MNIAEKIRAKQLECREKSLLIELEQKKKCIAYAISQVSKHIDDLTNSKYIMYIIHNYSSITLEGYEYGRCEKEISDALAFKYNGEGLSFKYYPMNTGLFITISW